MINITIKGIELRLVTQQNVFAPSAVDQGTLAMLSQVEFKPGDKVLDLGCGYGVVGVLAAKIIGPEQVFLTDISEEAVALAKHNAQLNAAEVKVIISDGFRDFDEGDFSLILSNPPYHTDFSVARHFIENSYRRLVPGGRLYMVTKRLAWYKNKIISVFGGVRISEIDGYYVFMAEKRSAAKPRKAMEKQSLSRKLARKKRRDHSA